VDLLEATLNAQVSLETTAMKSKSSEDIELMKAQLAQIEAQIARMNAAALPQGTAGGAGESGAPVM